GPLVAIGFGIVMAVDRPEGGPPGAIALFAVEFVLAGPVPMLADGLDLEPIEAAEIGVYLPVIRQRALTGIFDQVLHGPDLLVRVDFLNIGRVAGIAALGAEFPRLHGCGADAAGSLFGDNVLEGVLRHLPARVLQAVGLEQPVDASVFIGGKNEIRHGEVSLCFWLME